MSVDQTQGKNGKTVLKNRMEVSFRGISFSADDIHPAQLSMLDNSVVQHLTLVSWEQASPLSFRFHFTQDASITFAVSDSTQNASLTVSVQLPENARAFSLMYNPETGYSVTDQTKTRALVSSKSAEYNMTAPLLENDYISFLSSNAVASYSRRVVVQAFTFNTITPNTPNADTASYEATVRQTCAALVTAAQSALQEPASVAENAVIAYVAEMAYNHRYSEAIDSVPDSFKKGSKRTYLSSPYFDSLVAMNPSLEMQIDNMNSMIQNSVANNSLDAFAAPNLTDFMLRNSKSATVTSLVSLPAKLSPLHPTLSQATGIIEVYVKLAKANSPLADSLSREIDTCISTISSSCKKDGEKLLLVEKDASASVAQSVETGCALIAYGTYAGNTTYASAGRLIVNSVLAGGTVTDLHTLAAIYPIIASGNTFYPHAVILGSTSGRTVWAWTAANSISYTMNDAGTEADITIDFPEGDSHYVMIKGIAQFSSIDIYNMAFHTDPRFETYNSSGYVYNADNHTLFLKSRHKSATEVIRLHYKNSIGGAQTKESAPAENTSSAAPEKSEDAEETNYAPISESDSSN